LQARQADAAAAWVLGLGISHQFVERKRCLWTRTGVSLEVMQANLEALHDVLGMSTKQVRPLFLGTHPIAMCIAPM
jgi:hypothetical protein